MRNALNAFVLGAVALMVGCSADASGSLANQPARDSAAADSNGSKGAPTTTAASTPVAPAVAACSGVAAPTSLSDAKDASDIHVAGTAVFFQSGTSVNQVLKAGGAKAAPIFTSPNLVRSYVDKQTLLTVEQTGADDPTATLRTFAATQATDDNGDPTGVDPAFPTFPVNVDGDDPGGTTAATNFNAAGTVIFGSDDDNIYLQADDGNGNSEIVQVNRTDLTQTVLVNSDKVISSPQIASSAIWYVLDNQRVFMITLATDDDPTTGTPTEMFGQGNAQCNLAVTNLNAYCSIGTEIDSRDLTGASPKTLLTEQQSKVTGAGFGAAMANNGTLFVRDNSADPNVQHVIRALTTGDSPTETFLACNRGQVTGIAVDSDSVVWTENGAGVFVTKRQ